RRSAVGGGGRRRVDGVLPILRHLRLRRRRWAADAGTARGEWRAAVRRLRDRLRTAPLRDPGRTGGDGRPPGSAPRAGCRARSRRGGAVCGGAAVGGWRRGGANRAGCRRFLSPRRPTAGRSVLRAVSRVVGGGGGTRLHAAHGPAAGLA